MKLLLKIVLILLTPAFAKAQTRPQMDSAYFTLQHAANDTSVWVLVPCWEAFMMI